MFVLSILRGPTSLFSEDMVVVVCVKALVVVCEAGVCSRLVASVRREAGVKVVALVDARRRDWEKGRMIWKGMVRVQQCSSRAHQVLLLSRKEMTRMMRVEGRCTGCGPDSA